VKIYLIHFHDDPSLPSRGCTISKGLKIQVPSPRRTPSESQPISVQEVECDLVTRSSIVVESESMTSVRLDIVLDNCGVRVRILQILQSVRPHTITVADIKVEFGQHKLDRCLEARSLKAYDMKSGGKLPNGHWLLEGVAVIEHLWGECGVGIATEEEILNATLLTHNIPT
jgi:hypothetical protein